MSQSSLYFARQKYIEIAQAMAKGNAEAVEKILNEIRVQFAGFNSGRVSDIPLIIVQVSDWVISYVNLRRVNLDSLFEILVHAINQHLDEYVFSSSPNTKRYTALTAKGVIFAPLLSRIIQGEIPIDPIESEICHFARLFLLKETLAKCIDKACNDFEREEQKQAEVAELKKYANVKGGKLADRLEPIIEKLIDLLTSKLEDDEELDLTELTKLFNTVLVPVAKMRKEINDGTEINITKNNVFAQIMRIADGGTEDKEKLIESSKLALEAEYKLI
jgi:hypothetical protein